MSISSFNIDLRETHLKEVGGRDTYTIGAGTREWLVPAALCPALGSHGIGLAGITEADGDFAFVRPAPPWGQILACTGGGGWVWLGDAWVACEAGSVYITPPGVFHAYRAEGAGQAWSLCWVQMNGSRLLTGDRPALLPGDAGPLAAAIAGLHREVMSATDPALLPPWAFLVSSYAERLVRPVGGDPRLRRLWEAVGADLAAPWTVDTLARRMGVSPEHLRRLCQSHLRTAPMHHVAALRMRRAASLLASESYTVEAVARLVGYDNPYTFSTAFKRQMGLPPSEYRQGKPRAASNNLL